MITTVIKLGVTLDYTKWNLWKVILHYRGPKVRVKEGIKEERIEKEKRGLTDEDVMKESNSQMYEAN